MPWTRAIVCGVAVALVVGDAAWAAGAREAPAPVVMQQPESLEAIEVRLRRVALELEHGMAERERIAERLLALQQQIDDAQDRVTQAKAGQAEAADQAQAALARERGLSFRLAAAQQAVRDTERLVQAARSELGALVQLQRALAAITWVAIEERHEQNGTVSIWLRNTNRSASVRTTFRRGVYGSNRPLPAPETILLNPGMEVQIGSRGQRDRIVREAEVLGAEWQRGEPPRNIRRVAVWEIREAEYRVAEAQNDFQGALAAKDSEARLHAEALAALRAARELERSRMREATIEERAAARAARDQMLGAAQIRDMDRRLAALEAERARLVEALIEARSGR